MVFSRAKHGRTEKERWLPSAPLVALFTLFVCCLYGILLPILMMKKFNKMQNYTSYSAIDLRGSHYPSKLSNRGNQTTVVNATSSTGRSSVKSAFESSGEFFPRPIVIHRLQTQISRLSMNKTIVDNSDGKTLQRERLHVLEVLMNHFSGSSHLKHSDIVELRHCRLEKVDYSSFSSWAAVILHDARQKYENRFRRSADEAESLTANNTVDSIYMEFCLGLLEVFTTHSKDDKNEALCDFEKYSLTPKKLELLTGEESALKSVPLSSDGLPRLVFVIVAFQDAAHLEALIEACNMPHHLIVIHLERRSPTSFTESVVTIANKHTNVFVVKFGSIIYQTDSVSTVNYQIMHWLTEELQIPYDYYLTLGNAAYPLYEAQELTDYFSRTERDIWLGELRSHKNAGWIPWGYLERKRLVFTAGDEKFTQRTKKWKQNGFDAPIPEYIQTNMTGKTNSGNQAVFSYKVVQKLITSPQIRELFSLAKYGCCCCLEERTWYAAANIVGFGREALEAASMFQVWGGEPKCGDGSMKNALLIPNATICYKSEDVTKSNLAERQRTSSEDDANVEHSYFRGDKLLEELRLAKQRGFLFARKFKSTSEDSLRLLEMIKTRIHNH